MGTIQSEIFLPFCTIKCVRLLWLCYFFCALHLHIHDNFGPLQNCSSSWSFFFFVCIVIVLCVIVFLKYANLSRFYVLVIFSHSNWIACIQNPMFDGFVFKSGILCLGFLQPASIHIDVRRDPFLTRCDKVKVCGVYVCSAHDFSYVYFELFFLLSVVGSFIFPSMWFL